MKLYPECAGYSIILFGTFKRNGEVRGCNVEGNKTEKRLLLYPVIKLTRVIYVDFLMSDHILLTPDPGYDAKAGPICPHPCRFNGRAHDSSPVIPWAGSC